VFNNVLDALTGLLPKYFIFGSFVPVLIFSFINGALLYLHVAAFRTFAREQIGVPAALYVAVLLVGLIVVAYVLSAVSGFLRELLEGKHWWFFEQEFREVEQRRRDDLDTRYEEARDDAARLHADAQTLRTSLVRAANQGAAKHRGVAEYDRAVESGPIMLDFLLATRSKRPIRYSELSTAVKAMSATLRSRDIRQIPALRADLTTLHDLIDDAANGASFREFSLFAQRQADFGVSTPAPTRMGNVAAALNAYTSTRYDFDLDTFWSRFQTVLQRAEDKGHESLLDAKTQLDFLIVCFWLTTATWIVWFSALILAGTSPWVFTAISIIGPVATFGFYRLAVTNYLSYGALVRATVDLNRFALLSALHVALPKDLKQERALWSALGEVSEFGSDEVELVYDHGGGTG
jgi:hypothetical protein